MDKKYMEVIKKRLQKSQKTLSGVEPEIIFEEFKD
jgi:hypothetical protein